MKDRYLPTTPKSVPAGRVLCHNHVAHTVDHAPGMNGFRAWTADKPPDGFKQCPCGWSGLLHYAHGELFSGKCITE